MPETGSQPGNCNTDRKIGIGLLVCCSLLFLVIIPREIDASSSGLMGLNPAFMPKLLTMLLAGFSGLLILFGKPADKAEDSPAEGRRNVWLTLAFLVFYAYAIEPLGYLLSTGLALAGFLYFFGTRRIWMITAVSVSVPFILYWFFGKVMLVMLPAGTLFQ